MRLERIQAIATSGVSIDTETHRIQIGLPVPPMVVGSSAWLDSGPLINGTLLEKGDALQAFALAIEDPDVVLIFANGAFDLAVFIVELAKLGIDAMPAVFQALEEGRIFDVLIAEALNAIAGGHLGNDPTSGGPIINPETGRRGRYSLSVVVMHVLGRTDAKANDEYRLRYDELEHVPIAEWPPAARDYPVDDAKNTHEVALAQCGHLPKIAYQHDWANFRRDDGSVYMACKQCGSSRISAQCNARSRHRNLVDHANQVYSALALHLGAAWGFSVDQEMVDKVEDHARKQRKATIGPFIDAGIIRADGTEDQSALKRMVAIAYGATDPCPQCAGTGKVPSSVEKTLQCPECRGRCVPWKSGGRIKDPTVAECARCRNTGKVPHPNPNMVVCVGSAGVKTCDGTGLLLTDDVTRTKKDGIGKGRDTLHESGDEFLMSLGDFKQDAKILKDYVPFLRTARLPVAGHADECPVRRHTAGKKRPACTCLGPYYDVPLILRPNGLLETGRVSYDGYIMLLPRKPGYWDGDEYVPSIRECIRARTTQYELVEVPEDYVLQAGEIRVVAAEVIDDADDEEEED